MGSKKLSVLAVIVAVGVFFLFYSMENTISFSATASIILVGAYFVPCVLVCLIRERADTRNSAGFGNYDQEKKILEVKGRVLTNSKKLKIEAIYLPVVKFKPTEITYTGDTVGGVHAGGFSVNEAYYSASQVRPSGKYKLSYFVISKKQKYLDVEKIKLTEDLVAEAKKNSFIKTFLKDDCLVLKYNVENDENLKILAKAVVANPHDMQTLNAVSNYRKERESLTKEDCQRIIDWLCGKSS